MRSGIEELLAQQAFLRRLAARLVADEATADDLVQETMVLALDRGPLRAESLRAWLATAMRRLAGHGRRGERRRVIREELAARSERTSVALDELDRRLDAQVLLAELLRALPDVQRQALLMRYADERSPREIADALGVSVDTVKTRLRRGLEALRSELDRRHGGRREMWALALCPALARVGPGAALAPAAPAAGKGIAMALGWKLSVVGVAAAVTAGVWWTGRDLSAPEEIEVERVAEALAPTPPSEVVDAPRADARAAAPAEPSAREAAAVERPPTSATPAIRWPLHLVLEGPRDEANPAAVARIRDARSPSSTPASVVEARIDVPGEALLDVGSLVEAETRPEELVIDIEHATLFSQPARVLLARSGESLEPPKAPWEARIELLPGAVIVGHVSGAESNEKTPLVIAYPLAGGEPETEHAHSTAPESDGSFRIVLREAGEQVVVALAPERRPACARVAASLGSTVDAGELALDEGARLAGVVVREGRPVGAGAMVGASIQPLEDWHYPTGATWIRMEMLAWRDGRFEWASAFAEADDEGRFVLSGLAPLEYSLFLSRPPTDLGTMLPGNGGALRVRAPDESVELACDGPLVRVRLVPPEPADLRGDLVVRCPKFPDWREQANTWKPVELAELQFYAPADVELELTPEVQGFEADPTTLRTPKGPELVERTIALRPKAAPARLKIALSGELPAERTRFHVRLEDPKSEAEVAYYRPGDARMREVWLRDGALDLGEVPSGRTRIRFYPSTPSDQRSTLLLDGLLELELAPGEERVAEATLALGGNLHIVALDADGEPCDALCEVTASDGRTVPVTFVAFFGEGMSTRGRTSVSAKGPAQIEPNLAPGRYSLRFRLQGHRELVREVVVRAGETQELTVQLERE